MRLHSTRTMMGKKEPPHSKSRAKEFAKQDGIAPLVFQMDGKRKKKNDYERNVKYSISCLF